MGMLKYRFAMFKINHGIINQFKRLLSEWDVAVLWNNPLTCIAYVLKKRCYLHIFFEREELMLSIKFNFKRELPMSSFVVWRNKFWKCIAYQKNDGL